MYVYIQDHPAPTERSKNTRTELHELNLTGLWTDSAAFAAVKARLAGLEYPLLRLSLGKLEATVLASAKDVSIVQMAADGASECTLVARLKAAGGSGNDVRVLLFDEDNCLNWQNRHAAQGAPGVPWYGGDTALQMCQDCGRGHV